MDLQDKKILVYGAGISGVAAANLLAKTTASVVIYDGNPNLEIDELKKKLVGNEVNIIVGVIPENIRKTIDIVVVSPGVPTDLPDLIKFADDGVPIIGEIELAYMFSKGKIIGVTGTNGKTTTTSIIGQILRAHYESSFVVGNIGIPYTEMVTKTKNNSVTVAEISSFQLETIKSFEPDVSLILNITPDHLNRHHTMENYIEAKINITKNQLEDKVCILNYEDEELRKREKNINAKIIYFSSETRLRGGIFIEDDTIIYNNSIEDIKICNVNELKLLGKHNYENVMAAVMATIMIGVPLDIIIEEIKKFVSVEHRIEYVKEVHGVKYYNDSKGTNPDAAIKAVEAMVTPTLLIAGGYDKDSSYDEWIETFDGKIKKLVLIGQTREKIAQAARNKGFEAIELADTLEEAVAICKKSAQKGDAVLLSPACASWGMFKNYEERGNEFKRLVNEMK
ncbi:MAG: UDP-N-acetylmuramoyl-L-alanine--D-glutamate ligase [Lachnospiraceae bacterium]|nr:UDP-N-acetylmuramoyl-L-alanine--D-glutamate ligase [Lachnospiraceae bacterium]